MSGHICQMDRGQISWVTSASYDKQCSSGPYNECGGNPVSKKLSGGLDKFDFHLIFESMTFGKQLTGAFFFRVRASNRALCCNGA